MEMKEVKAYDLLNEVMAGYGATFVTDGKKNADKMVGLMAYLSQRRGIDLVIHRLDDTRIHFEVIGTEVVA